MVGNNPYNAELEFKVAEDNCTSDHVEVETLPQHRPPNGNRILLDASQRKKLISSCRFYLVKFDTKCKN